MDNVVNNTSKTNDIKKTSLINILIWPFYTIANILVFAAKGFKACFYDLWLILFNSASYKLDKIYQSAKEEDLSSDDIYEKTKKVKKAKVYKYSAKTLAKLEQEKAALLEDLQKAGATRSKDAHMYLFKVKEPSGRITTGTMSGFSKLDINSFLLNEGYEVYSIKTSPFIDFVYQKSTLFGSKKYERFNFLVNPTFNLY